MSNRQHIPVIFHIDMNPLISAYPSGCAGVMVPFPTTNFLNVLKLNWYVLAELRPWNNVQSFQSPHFTNLWICVVNVSIHGWKFWLFSHDLISVLSVNNIFYVSLMPVEKLFKHVCTAGERGKQRFSRLFTDSKIYVSSHDIFQLPTYN